MLANLPTGYTAANVKIPNIPFNKTDGVKWLRLSVVDQDVNNVQAGGLWLRYNALLVIDVFYPKGKDTITQLTEAELIATSFENQSFGGADNNDVKCFEALIEEVGVDESWYHVQININATYEGSRI